MKDVYLRFYHPSIKALSDKTFRNFLKDISKAVREAHVSEVITLIETSELPLNEMQSLRDRLRHQLETDQCYYIESFKKGSIEFTIAASAVSIWLLQTTIGESVKEAYMQSRMHKRIVKYLQRGKRDKLLAERIEDNIRRKGRVGRFGIEGTKKTATTRKIVITVNLNTPPELLEQMELPQEP